MYDITVSSSVFGVRNLAITDEEVEEKARRRSSGDPDFWTMERAIAAADLAEKKLAWIDANTEKVDTTVTRGKAEYRIIQR